MNNNRVRAENRVEQRGDFRSDNTHAHERAFCEICSWLQEEELNHRYNYSQAIVRDKL
jgi:hypothetical protein